MQECKITFGRLLWSARRYHRLSQCEFCQIITSKYGSLDRYQLSKIENDRLEIQSIDYDWLIPAIAELFAVDVEWLEQIRSQTEPEPLD